MCKPENKALTNLTMLKLRYQTVKIQDILGGNIIFTTAIIHKKIAFQDIKEALPNQKKTTISAF